MAAAQANPNSNKPKDAVGVTPHLGSGAKSKYQIGLGQLRSRWRCRPTTNDDLLLLYRLPPLLAISILSQQINVKPRDHTAGVAVDRAHRDVRDHRGKPPAFRDCLANPRRGFHSPKRKMQVRDHRDGQ